MIDVSFLQGAKVAVMGLGKSGGATVRALHAAGAHVLAWDDNEKARIDAPFLTDLHGADFFAIDLLVWSPGIPHTHPTRHPVAEAARAANVPMVCDIDLLARAKPDTRTFGVTGTNGKSTTTTLLAHILAQAGRAVAAGGNLGTPALDLPDLGADGRYVLELSSYQLELVPSLALDAGVLLNITPDHLGRHGGMDGYIAAKRVMVDRIRPGGTLVIGIDDDPCRRLAESVPGAVRISACTRLDKGISAQDGQVFEDGRAVADLSAFPLLPGAHNAQNICAAFAMARADGVEPAAILAAIASYPGLAHRQERVAQEGRVLFINDSKATNADATEKALVCYDDIFWILGGQAKEGGITALAPYFPRIRHAFLIGEAAPAFASVLSGKVAFTQCGTLEVAVREARRHAKDLGRGVVLLSPACASWDQFTSFEHRGDSFRRLVRETAP